MPSWVAIYNDGSSLSQLSSDGVEVARYDAIDRVRLTHFIILGGDGKPIVVLHLRPGSKLIYRQRVELGFSGEEKGRVILVGWQETRNGANFQSITAVFPDHVEVMGRFEEGHPWLYPVVFREEEKLGV